MKKNSLLAALLFSSIVAPLMHGMDQDFKNEKTYKIGDIVKIPEGTKLVELSKESMPKAGDFLLYETGGKYTYVSVSSVIALPDRIQVAIKTSKQAGVVAYLSSLFKLPDDRIIGDGKVGDGPE